VTIDKLWKSIGENPKNNTSFLIDFRVSIASIYRAKLASKLGKNRLSQWLDDRQ
jgi:hypothetical protein